jgi:cyclopropane fatty-acyl-phospholipid synthase-like methyltransferase
MPRDVDQELNRNKAYFDREASDFDAMEKDPGSAQDPFRRLVNKYFFRLHKQNKRLDAMLAIARRRHADWAGRHVLELGCGHGRYSIELARMGARVTMVDVSPSMVAIARRNVAAAGVEDFTHVVECDLRTYRTDERFDLVFLTGVTDYLPRATVDELGTKLSRLTGDLAIVSFPKRYSPINWIRWVWLTFFKRVALTFFSRRSIRQFARKHGLTVHDWVDIPGYFVVGFTVNR